MIQPIPPEERPACEKCGSSNVAQIEYGLPPSNPALRSEADGQARVFGGCCLASDNPLWRCRVCGCDFGHFRVVVKDLKPVRFPWGVLFNPAAIALILLIVIGILSRGIFF